RLVHLFEREGSLSLRHRTAIEEAPAPGLSHPMRERLTEAALAVAEAAGYVGSGTADFLIAGDQLWFLGLKTRLDAGCAATEAVLGLDLVRMQLEVAEGRPVPVEARHCSPSGHAVAAHLLATDPAGVAAGGVSPDRPRLRRFDIGPAAGVRVETGLAAGAAAPPRDHVVLATVVAQAATRAEAVHRLAAALEGARIHGVSSNREELVAILRHPAFLAGEIDTAFFDRHASTLGSARGGLEAVRVHAVAAALAGRPRPSSGSTVFRGPDGQRVEVRYRVDPMTGGVTDGEVNGVPLPGLRVGDAGPAAVDVEIGGLRRRVSVVRTGDIVDCDSRLGHTELAVLQICETLDT
ncbi:MAG TPA: acetyl/propionyl-CoA carboxylase subunit alpha, partial [Acidimicrobiia bacterium]|nr:acetyl/propionyl-CoA carboxylase subunit alpha [Acidimicrobiia bacterium]